MRTVSLGVIAMMFMLGSCIVPVIEADDHMNEAS
jgi:hypothetical protein